VKRTGGQGLTKIRLSVCFTMLLVLVIVLVMVRGCLQEKAQEKADVDAKVEHIHQLVSVGMDIDEAAETLREQGFTVGDKYKPTKRGDYYVVNVRLRKGYSVSDTIRYTVGSPGDRAPKKKYLVIEADTEGVITSIE